MKKIYIFSTFVAGILGVFVFSALAADVTVNSNINIPLTISSESIIFELSGGANISSLTAQSDRVNILTPDGEKAILTGPDSISFGVATACDTPGKSKLEIPGNSSVTVIPLKPVSTDAEYKNTCAGRVANGGGGSPPPPPPPPSPSPSPPSPSPVPPSTTPKVEVPTDPIEPLDEGIFKDVKGNDEKYVLPIIGLMLEKFTYEIPVSKIFGVKRQTDGNFAVQVAAALSGLGCGSSTAFPGASACREYLSSAKLVTSKFPKGKITRLQYLELLLKARGFKKLENKTTAALKKECGDVKNAKKQDARVYFTAKKLGIAKKFKGGKCGLGKGLTRVEAAKLALRAYGVSQ